MSPFNSVHMTSCSPFIESVYVPFPRYTVAVICKFFSYTMYIWRPDGDDLIGISAISLSSNQNTCTANHCCLQDDTFSCYTTLAQHRAVSTQFSWHTAQFFLTQRVYTISRHTCLCRLFFLFIFICIFVAFILFFYNNFITYRIVQVNSIFSVFMFAGLFSRLELLAELMVFPMAEQEYVLSIR